MTGAMSGGAARMTEPLQETPLGSLQIHTPNYRLITYSYSISYFHIPPSVQIYELVS